jgi:hypothetical protein
MNEPDAEDIPAARALLDFLTAPGSRVRFRKINRVEAGGRDLPGRFPGSEYGIREITCNRCFRVPVLLGFAFRVSRNL